MSQRRKINDVELRALHLENICRRIAMLAKARGDDAVAKGFEELATELMFVGIEPLPRCDARRGLEGSGG